MSLLRLLSGDRPMKEITGNVLYIPFADLLKGGVIRFYSAKGRIWMAKTPWSLFRVEAPVDMRGAAARTP